VVKADLANQANLLQNARFIFFRHAGGFLSDIQSLLPRRETGFRLNTLPE
jgi:hypothetical protein